MSIVLGILSIHKFGIRCMLFSPKEMDNLESFINEQFEKREKIDAKQDNNELKNTIKDIIQKLDNGELRIAEKINNEWIVNQWLKKAVLLSFMLDENVVIPIAIDIIAAGNALLAY